MDSFLQKIIKDIYDFKNIYQNGIIIIYGPTASGKTWLSVDIANNFANTNIVSCDSRQVYKFMDIWTDKVSIDIRSKIPHHQIDIITPNQNYSASDWQSDTYDTLDNINIWDNLTLLVWGTWLYIDTIYRNYNLWNVGINLSRRTELENIELQKPGYCWNMLNNIDPQESQKHHPSSLRFIIRAIEIYEQVWIPKSIYMSQKKVKYPLLMIWLLRDADIWNTLIDDRIYHMLDNWLVNEVRWLMKIYDPQLKSMQSIDYKQVIWYINWEYNHDNMVQLLKIANHQLAKKQRTRFRKYKYESIHNPKRDVIYKEYIVWL